MTKADALQQLHDLDLLDDEEIAHVRADDVLLALIDDDEITEAFKAIHKWYA